MNTKQLIHYKTVTRYYLADISSYVLIGALSGLGILLMMLLNSDLKLIDLSVYEYGLAMTGGMLLGAVVKTMMMVAVEMVMRANAASANLNAKRAKTLGERLKKETKSKVQASVIAHAKEIIFQMHGEEEGFRLESFFDKKMEAMTQGAYFKIDRHLNYLTDRAVHGDITALKRLYRLYRRSPQERAQEIDKLVDRIINRPREIEKLKDKIDTLYDQWKFRYYARGYVDE